ncbi:hypothetical protein X777_06388 [Ooceraea biroi]|uniref:Uncharacterized protein n=1 Tax=Ooceraea biroi TaxID=2015173 RepID=A0A026WE52_OOCBI|nr:hypothetical protein X777_06388 [Ooceraea biroi]
MSRHDDDGRARKRRRLKRVDKSGSSRKDSTWCLFSSYGRVIESMGGIFAKEKRAHNGEPRVSHQDLLRERERDEEEIKKDRRWLGIVEVVAKHQTACLIREDPRVDTIL